MNPSILMVITIVHAPKCAAYFFIYALEKEDTGNEFGLSGVPKGFEQCLSESLSLLKILKGLVPFINFV